MTVLSISPLCHNKHKPILLISSSTSHSRMATTVCCLNRDPNGKANKGIKQNERLTLQQFLGGLEKLGKGVQDNLSPKHKGDWKDIILMSISFAVYVYMSQKIVCAYCAWMSMIRHPW